MGDIAAPTHTQNGTGRQCGCRRLHEAGSHVSLDSRRGESRKSQGPATESEKRGGLPHRQVGFPLPQMSYAGERRRLRETSYSLCLFFLNFFFIILLFNSFFFVSEKMFGHSHGTTLEIMRFRDLIDVKLNWSRKSSWWVDCEQFGRSCAVKFGVCLSRSVACALLASSRPLVSRLAAALSAADENNQSAGVWLLSGARCARPQLVVFSHKELTSELFWWRRKSQKNGRGRKGNNMCELLFNKRQTLSI